MMKTYEAMFLVDAGNPDFEAAAAPVRDVLARGKAEILALKPWDERKLCYDIKGRSRGLYILAYFKADPLQVTPMQHEVELNEQIMRALFLHPAVIKPEEIAAETPLTAAKLRRPPEAPVAAPVAAAPAGTEVPAGAEAPAVTTADVPAESPAAPQAEPAPEENAEKQ
jgi:small subunit ribosomal protein S6